MRSKAPQNAVELIPFILYDTVNISIAPGTVPFGSVFPNAKTAFYKTPPSDSFVGNIRSGARLDERFHVAQIESRVDLSNLVLTLGAAQGVTIPDPFKQPFRPAFYSWGINFAAEVVKSFYKNTALTIKLRANDYLQSLSFYTAAPIEANENGVHTVMHAGLILGQPVELPQDWSFDVTLESDTNSINADFNNLCLALGDYNPFSITNNASPGHALFSGITFTGSMKISMTMKGAAERTLR